jgi:hypothetical protein
LRVAAFYSDSPFAGWVQAEGFCDVLKRMGHEVIPIGIPPVTSVNKERARKINKPIDDCDLVIVSGPEHLQKWISTFYPDWAKVKAPKLGWYHESFEREDYTLDYEQFKGWLDFHFFPDKRDAEKYKGEWLPLGVDTAIFKSSGHEERDVECAFIGLMYPKRSRFVDELRPKLGDIPLQFRSAARSENGLIPAIAVYDFDGLNVRRSMELLADAYRRIKVFVTFPSLSNVLVAKVLESMACGCKLVAPKQPVEFDGYFPYETVDECAAQIRKALEADIPRPDVSEHRMELRFEKIFKKVGA